ncbi:MAG: formate dehydrogenase subunit gamma [Gemmatimonadales bacterium]
MRPGDLDRFTLFERLVHWLVGLSFVLLLLTGLAFSYPALYWLTSLVGGGPTARLLHPWIGMLFSVGVVLMFVLWVSDMHVNETDVKWLRAIPHYARHENHKVPPVGKYNAGQKAFFWLQSVLGVVFLVSGIPLWMPASFGSGLLTISRVVHYAAALGGGLLLILHVYLGTVGFPGTARGMLYGRVSRAWAKLHHPLWYREKTGSRGP